MERCVGDPGEFVQYVFGVEPWLHDGTSYDDVLSLEDVDAALTGSGVRRPTVRVVREGEVIDPAKWTRRVRTGAVVVDDMVDPARVLDLYARGATVVLQSMQRWWPPVARFCRELETVLGHPVQANAYLTGPGAVGLAPHHDTHDVFVLQIHGSKHWVVREPVVDRPLRRHRSEPASAARQPVVFETDLVPGMCLYLPRGTVHSAHSQERSSLHLTIGLLAVTAADVVRRVAALAGDVPALRRSLPVGWLDDPAVREQAVRSVLADLALFVGSVDADQLAEELGSSVVRSRRPLLHGLLIDVERLNSLDDDAVVCCRQHVVSAIENAGTCLRVRMADRTIELPAALGPAVCRLVAGRPVRVGDLADALDQHSRMVLVRRLVREGVLTIIEMPAGGSGRHG